VGDHWGAVTTLADRSRRALYDYVRHQDHAVSREEAAEAAGMSRGLAAFHLDKLVDAGLLRARYAPPPDQPRGRGRAPKVYEPTGDGVRVTIPERRYELMAEILADAVAEDPSRADDAARRHARRRGREVGAELSEGDREIDVALEGLGFEPRRSTDGRVLLDNCPFRSLATRHTALVCGLNHAFLAGLVEEFGPGGLEARLAPRPGMCCVELAAPPAAGGSRGPTA
jgi:predicted ArsR family transcriptional regulator